MRNQKVEYDYRKRWKQTRTPRKLKKKLKKYLIKGSSELWYMRGGDAHSGSSAGYATYRFSRR